MAQSVKETTDSGGVVAVHSLRPVPNLISPSLYCDQHEHSCVSDELYGRALYDRHEMWERVGSGVAEWEYNEAGKVSQLERALVVYAVDTMELTFLSQKSLLPPPALNEWLRLYAPELAEIVMRTMDARDQHLVAKGAIEAAINRKVSELTGIVSTEVSDTYFPAFMYHIEKEPVRVFSARGEEELGPEWSREYIREYPKRKGHWHGKTITVSSAAEDAALGSGWADTRAEFAPYKGPRRLGLEHIPDRWVDGWQVCGLVPEHRVSIKAAIWKADSEFWNLPDDLPTCLAAMRTLFNAVANVLFAAGILTEKLVREDILLFVWDCAIAAGWWRRASETPNGIFRERLGHYWVWRDEDGDGLALFRSETGRWLTKVFEQAAAAAQPSSVAAESMAGETPSPWLQSVATPEPQATAGMAKIDRTKRSQAEKAAERQAVIDPKLKQKGWKPHKWAAVARVSKNSVYGYRDGKRNLSSENRTAMAAALGLTADALPE
jgi:hypothetical protein